jgi:hypothetical protein
VQDHPHSNSTAQLIFSILPDHPAKLQAVSLDYGFNSLAIRNAERTFLTSFLNPALRRPAMTARFADARTLFPSCKQMRKNLDAMWYLPTLHRPWTNDV